MLDSLFEWYFFRLVVPSRRLTESCFNSRVREMRRRRRSSHLVVELGRRLTTLSLSVQSGKTINILGHCTRVAAVN